MTPPATAAAAHRGQHAPAAPVRPRVAPRTPRRVSGPARRPQRPLAQPAGAEGGLALGLVGAFSSLSRHHALDRLIRGRAWIALIAFGLIGIVTLQLLVLTLNAHIGRALEREASLQRENAAYSIEDSELASGERIESQAGRLGMELIPMDALRFLTADPRADLKRAAAALNTPVHSSSAGTSVQTSAATSAPSGGEASTATATEASSPSTPETGTDTTAPASSVATPTASGEPSGQASTGAASTEHASSAPVSQQLGATSSPPTSTGAVAAATGAEAAPAGAAGGTGAPQANGAG